ncbi:hypothetical protein LNV09_05270 [Paucibacter sp. B2R-40]|uniref:VPA1267 family protein n=1 Tax=Paucibacter sp. B2R-40 TaxID=2893554 RepID=UPI0021E4AFCB|nr:VPA1267 family protein [Paucibacter sp. B2R-40]MCV2353569.1 hypothetical protein [Paucibacter sp. B2R-40]
MPSVGHLAAQAVRRFNEWVVERDRAADWPDYIRAGKLNRSELAKECEFGRAALQQNPSLAAALAALEVRLADQGVLSAAPLVDPELKAMVGAADEQVRRAMSARATLEKRVKTLEEQNAALRAETAELRERLRRSALADIHLSQTGRLLPP